MPQRLTWNSSLVWSTACIAATALVVLALLPSVVRAAFGPDDEVASVGERFERLIEDHDEALGLYTERFNGRSVFFKPPQQRRAPTPPPREKPKVVDNTPPPPPRPKPKPPYSGPSIKGFVGAQVWFAGDLRVSLGEEKDGLEVLELDLPWMVRVRHSGHEYEVPFREKLDDGFFKSGSGVSATPGMVELTGDARSPGRSRARPAGAPRRPDE
jgi:hypothetical protein